jgi:hypothetical protein
MAGLGPAIHDDRFATGRIVDARIKSGHDELLENGAVLSATPVAPQSRGQKNCCLKIGRMA